MRPKTSNAPRERETAQEIAGGRLNAAKQLFYLFGGTDAAGQTFDGVLHQNPISVLEADPGWKTYLDGVRKDPHAKTLAVISASRNVPNFPPVLVTELFSNEERDQDSRWFSDVFLTGAAQIHAATGTGLILPVNHASLDLVRSAFNLVDHLSAEERKGLNLCMPDEAPKRKLATTLAGILVEATTIVDEPGLTAAQRFYRWAVRRWEDREDAADERRRQRAAGGSEKEKDGDPASILPLASGKTAMPAPPQAAAGPVLPPVPKPNGEDKEALASTKVPTPPVPVAAVPAAPPAPATPAPAANSDQELILAAIAASGTPGKAMVTLVRKGQKTMQEAETFASARGLL